MSPFQRSGFKLAHAVIAGVTVVLLCTAAQGVVKNIEVIPEQACPGQTVLLRMDHTTFKDASAIIITIAGKPAEVVRVVDGDKTIVAMIPNLSAQKDARILVNYFGPKGDGKLDIIPSPLRRVFLRMERNTITVERTQPYNGEYDPNPTAGRRISYDVFSEAKGIKGGMRFLYTGAVLHPAERTVEAFGPPGEPSPTRAPASTGEPYRFVVKIPYAPGTTVLKLYEASETADLWTAKGRKERTPIKTNGADNGIKIGGKP